MYILPSPCIGDFAPKEESVVVNGAHVLTEVGCAACVITCGSAQMQQQGRVFSPVVVIPYLVQGYGVEWAGPEHSFGRH